MNELKKSGPKDVFLHILAFGALYASIIAFINLIFGYINFSFPDPLSFFETGVLNGIRSATSVLIVIFPVFLLVSYLLEKDFVQHPEKRGLKFRKWLIYFTLFLAAVTVIVDLIVLVNSFYGGELTIQFFLKTLTVLSVAGAVFLYYKWELGREGRSRKSRNAAVTAAAVVLIAVVAGFFVVGSPAEQRAKRLDEDRVNDLSLIQSQVVSFWDARNRLPASLTELEETTGFIPVDPQTEEAYEYNVLGGRTFELCALFQTENKQVNDRGSFREPRPSFVRDVLISQNWDHEAGRFCFEREIILE